MSCSSESADRNDAMAMATMGRRWEYDGGVLHENFPVLWSLVFRNGSCLMEIFFQAFDVLLRFDRFCLSFLVLILFCGCSMLGMVQKMEFHLLEVGFA